MPKPTSKKVKGKKYIKASEVLDKWLKANCKEGEMLQVETSENCFVLTRLPDIKFAYKRVSTNKAKKK